MVNLTLGRLPLAALLLLPLPLSAAATLQPNLYELNGTNLRVTYSTTGIDGKPHLNYQDARRALSFSGDQIRTTSTEIGTLVSVTLNMTVDRGSTAFSILIPGVKLDATKQAPIKTQGITTQRKFSVIPKFNAGQTDNYTFTPLSGKARFVFF